MHRLIVPFNSNKRVIFCLNCSDDKWNRFYKPNAWLSLPFTLPSENFLYRIYALPIKEDFWKSNAWLIRQKKQILQTKSMIDTVIHIFIKKKNTLLEFTLWQSQRLLQTKSMTDTAISIFLLKNFLLEFLWQLKLMLENHLDACYDNQHVFVNDLFW